MRALKELEVIIVGCDPGTGAGKPIAAVSTGFWPNGASVILDWSTAHVGEGIFVDVLLHWGNEVLTLVEVQKASGDTPVYVVSERATARGGAAWKNQALVHHLKEVCGDQNITFLPPIAPTRLKKLVTGSGKSTAGEVGRVIRATVINGEMLPESAGFDWEAAAGAAVAGNKELKAKQLEGVKDEYQAALDGKGGK